MFTMIALLMIAHGTSVVLCWVFDELRVDLPDAPRSDSPAFGHSDTRAASLRVRVCGSGGGGGGGGGEGGKERGGGTGEGGEREGEVGWRLGGGGGGGGVGWRTREAAWSVTVRGALT